MFKLSPVSGEFIGRERVHRVRWLVYGLWLGWHRGDPLASGYVISLSNVSAREHN
jgi:hypothetical protein